MYWSWGTTIIWLPTNLFKNMFPLQTISMVCMKKKRSNESFNKFANFLRILPSMWSKIGAFFLWNKEHYSKDWTSLSSLLCSFFCLLQISKKHLLNYNMWQCISQQKLQLTNLKQHWHSWMRQAQFKVTQQLRMHLTLSTLKSVYIFFIS